MLLHVLICAVIGISILSDTVRELNKMRLAVDEDSWPPNRLQEFAPLLLVHHEGPSTFTPGAALKNTGSVQSGRFHSIQNSHQSDNSKKSKQLVDILVPLQDSDSAQFILIEGLPGIGKTMLLNEIAYNWATQQFLQKFKLVLLIQLRNPAVQKLSLVADLFQLFCKRETRAKEIADSCSEYLFGNKGKDVVFLFDGYDEFPEHLQKESLVADILNRRVLPHCGLVVSSRPHASVRLRQQATIRVDILGFAVEDQKLYIKQSLKGQPHAVKELIEYLNGNLTISGLCFIPFNMVILVYLYNKVNPLPNNSTQLYNYFIHLTICRHLAKSGQRLDNTTIDLAKLPQPYNTIVRQLSKLALEGINNNKLIFTLEEMRTACPDITASSETLSGFGLLKAVQDFGLTRETVTFNFVHFSIQEFLAAYHITQLPPEEELQVLQAKFWSNLHSNMFTMYTSLTKGQRSAFKQFLSGGDKTIIAEKFLKDPLKCLHLFRSFHEANDEPMYNSILKAQIFHKKVIDLRNKHSLSPYDIECVTLFLTCSPNKEWKKLNLWDCHIQDFGLRILYHGLTSQNVTIKVLTLSWNSLTMSSSSTVSDIAIHCRVEVLDIRGNRTIGEDPDLYVMLDSPRMELDMRSTGLSSPSAINLFATLTKRNKLRLNISDNSITDEACDFIATKIADTSLVELRMTSNKISAEAAQHLVQAIKKNSTLQVLQLPFYTEDVKEKIRSLQEEIVENRESKTILIVDFNG